MAKQNPFLAKLKAEAAAKESFKTQAHVEIDTMAMLLAAHERLRVGPGRAPDLVNDFLAFKMEIADELLKEILGKEGWEKYHTLFPFVREYWEW